MSEQLGIVRPLSEVDADQYSLLWLESRRLNPDIFSDATGEYDINFIRTRTREDLRQKTKIILGCEDNGELIGVGEVEREAPANRNHRARAYGMYVKESMRRRGVGEQLLDKIVQEARAMDGVEQIEFGLTGNNEGQRNFFESKGFESYGLHPRWMKVNGIYYDAQFMGLELGKPALMQREEVEKAVKAWGDLASSPKTHERHDDRPPKSTRPKLPGSMRKLTLRDATQYQYLRSEARRLHPDIFADSYEAEVRKTIAEIKREMKQRTIFGFVPEGGSEILGIAEYRREEDENKKHRAHLGGMFVKESVRRYGIGKDLVDVVIDHARKDGMAQLELGVVASNGQALKLYDRTGFNSRGAVHKNWMKVDGEAIHVHFMILPLDDEVTTSTHS